MRTQRISTSHIEVPQTEMNDKGRISRIGDVRKILVFGSGPIVIGQAAEFDYSGTQACLALKEEGYEVILVNSNPATIMTDQFVAHRVYIEPLSLEFVSRIIHMERPDAILPTLGGQTGLNLAIELAENGILDRYGIRVLGTSLAAIRLAEDREMFKDLMSKLQEPVPDSAIVRSVPEAEAFSNRTGFPVIVRPAYTLGGTGGGIAANDEELVEIVSNGLKHSPIGQCLVEQYIAGFKEVEYEVMRDHLDTAIVVCSMENFDPVGIHTGDSIVVAPTQTLSDKEHQMLRNSALKIIRALGIEGGCNIQFALDPESFAYYVIEVNPRVSRSSALASKATGYPIARIAAKIAVGFSLSEIRNPVTGKTFAGFEPTLDYVVTKIPRWPFDKFTAANRKLGTQMKATGEVMAIGRTLEESLLKAVRSLEIGSTDLRMKRLERLSEADLLERISSADDERLFVIAEAFRRGVSLEVVFERSKIDRFFLHKIDGIVRLEEELRRNAGDQKLLRLAKERGFSDKAIAELWQMTEDAVYQLRREAGIMPVYKMVDTCAGEFESLTPYYYGTYEEENESLVSQRPSVLVIGSGPIRIGQGIEFDYATVHSVLAIQKCGYEAIVINSNPETVSTDFSISDKLYFEPLTVEDVMHVIEHEKPEGVVVQFGGQTAINIASRLADYGVRILGTSLESLDTAEDRDRFEAFLEERDIPRPAGRIATSEADALQAASDIGYPVLVRPSYVLGGRAMEIVYHDEELRDYMAQAVLVNPQHPVLIDRYLIGTEVEVDAVCDGETVIIPGIMEHIERAGVHSGDSIAIYPTQTLSPKVKDRIEELTITLALGLGIIGLLNIQFVVQGDKVYVLEVNPRSSRTVPFLSKTTGIPMAELATRAILGQSLRQLGFSTGLYPESSEVSVKVPVFSFAKLRRVDTILGPEMKSTGEVMGHDRTLSKALYKGLVSAGMKIPTSGKVLFTIADKDKQAAMELVQRFHQIGFDIVATEGTGRAISRLGIPVQIVSKIGKGSPDLLDLIRKSEVHFVINTLTKGKQPARDGFQIRRHAVENNIVCLTSLDTAAALLKALELITFEARPVGAARQGA